MNNFIKLPNGDYISWNLVEKVKFTSEEDTQAIKHLVCEVHWTGDVIQYRDDNAIFIKDYLDKLYGGFFQMHKQDYATQIIALGYALERLEYLTHESAESISKDIIKTANLRVRSVRDEHINQMIAHYNAKVGSGEYGEVFTVNVPA